MFRGFAGRACRRSEYRPRRPDRLQPVLHQDPVERNQIGGVHCLPVAHRGLEIRTNPRPSLEHRLRRRLIAEIQTVELPVHRADESGEIRRRRRARGCGTASATTAPAPTSAAGSAGRHQLRRERGDRARDIRRRTRRAELTQRRAHRGDLRVAVPRFTRAGKQFHQQVVLRRQIRGRRRRARIVL